MDGQLAELHCGPFSLLLDLAMLSSEKLLKGVLFLYL